MKSIATSKKSSRTVLFLVLSLGIVAVIGVLYYLYFIKSSDFNNPITDNVVTNKDQSLTTGDSSNKGPGKTIVPAKPSQDENNNSNAPEKPQITRAEQTANGSIRIAATLSNASTGDCLLTLSQGAQTIKKTASIIVGPSYYTCDGFLVSRSELPSGGEWQATVYHERDGASTASDTKVINVE